MELIFQRAQQEDLEKIAAIEQVSFPDPWSVDSLWTFASDESIRTLVTAKEKESGELVGYYALQYVLDEAEIAILAVAVKYRRQGIGRELIDEIKSFCMRKKISVLHLEVRSENEAAIHLYRAMGFTEVGRRKDYYEKPKDDAILFSLSI
ncbi:MAG: ribosomal protein S18-alanine N-acetyltransferase [Clostridiales bacterium]|jgi:ribosomal-protein-alanine N-acetyltransferase|nr:ribosomal protein S18-alanine N-acetyltransferase [Clostridiales bacterium]